MATTIGLPSLTITFQAAAQQAANRSKKGYVGVFVRDAKAQGIHQLSSAALIPTELGQENQNYIRRAFTGSDRGGPSKVVVVVIATGTEDTTALEAGLKSIEGLTLDYLRRAIRQALPTAEVNAHMPVQAYQQALLVLVCLQQLLQLLKSN